MRSEHHKCNSVQKLVKANGSIEPVVFPVLPGGDRSLDVDILFRRLSPHAKLLGDLSTNSVVGIKLIPTPDVPVDYAMYCRVASSEQQSNLPVIACRQDAKEPTKLYSKMACKPPPVLRLLLAHLSGLTKEVSDEVD